jgi:putative thiamine transport system permease protein
MAASLRPVTASAPAHARASASRSGLRCGWPGLAAVSALAALPAVPLVWSLTASVAAGLDRAAWSALMAEPQVGRAVLLGLGAGLVSTALAVALTAWLLSQVFARPGWVALTRSLAPLLAVPHAAFAIGLAFLVAPSGWILRALSPWLTGFEAPPPWATTQDPWALGLVLALVAKETPFLLWAAASQLQRPEVARRWSQEMALARTLGYSSSRAWWRVVWPQLWPRLGAPVLAVLAYGATVVDMALVIGPASPPTASVLAWQWLLDADPRINAQGAALAWLLAAAVALLACLIWGALRPGRRGARAIRGDRGGPESPAWRRVAAFVPLAVLYAGVLLALAVGSVAGVWTFPTLLPQHWTMGGWLSVASSASTLWTTLGLAVASSLCALAWCVAWLEAAPAAWDQALRRLLYLLLLLPAVLWVLGLHRLALAWGLDLAWGGVWLAHTLMALPYVLIALSPSYLAFDSRMGALSASLGHGRFAFLLKVKWPLLRAGLLAALAVGFSVSVAQYLTTQFVGGGRFNTVTTEAVALASGGQRSLLAAYAWLQWLLPALGFAAALRLGSPRVFKRGVR